MYVACGTREIFWRGTVALSLRAVRQNRSIWHDTAVKDTKVSYESIIIMRVNASSSATKVSDVDSMIYYESKF